MGCMGVSQAQQLAEVHTGLTVFNIVSSLCFGPTAAGCISCEFWRGIFLYGEVERLGYIVQVVRGPVPYFRREENDFLEVAGGGDQCGKAGHTFHAVSTFERFFSQAGQEILFFYFAFVSWLQ